ncbi:MAG: SAM-dependent chlorinase/fluorinase [Candidatus Sumerlaeia bacterium]|nr:SAM-dependent chlorinase/fluorinase [Candidatus Sumerlaeia bacterium]
MSSPVVAMLTDYGRNDIYAGVLEATLLRYAPSARVISLTHDVPPQNLLSGAYLLASAVPYLPKGSTVLAVVDPGVGTGRRAVAVRTEHGTLVGPDNGLFDLVLADFPAVEIVELKERKYWAEHISQTFHGRDIFAPVAGHIANGVPLRSFGPSLDRADLAPLDLSPVHVESSRVLGTVIHTDHFGNVVTSIRKNDIAEILVKNVRVGAQKAPLRERYSDVEEGDLVSYIGSAGYMEIAVRNGNAAQRLQAEQGSVVMVAIEGEFLSGVHSLPKF